LFLDIAICAMPVPLGGGAAITTPEFDSHEELRSGQAPWQQPPYHPKPEAVDRDLHCDVLVVGAGITGSMLAASLSSLGHDVVIVDRERAGAGSTAASTAMLLWELDQSLANMVELIGFDRAIRVYQVSFEATQRLCGWIESLALPCGFARRPSLQLATDTTGAVTALRGEHALRERAGLPSHFMDAQQLATRFGMMRPAALISGGAAEVDPLLLARSLLMYALHNKARYFCGEAVQFDASSKGAVAVMDNGRAIEAKHIILATGYDMPSFVRCNLHSLSATWAVATQCTRSQWPHRALLWEAADNYLYARTAADLVVVGGEDEEDKIEPAQRQAAMGEKSRRLLQRLASLWPIETERAALAWSGVFGKTTDSLPLIGPVPGKPGLFAAYGYGGNGITFSYLSAEIIARLIRGERLSWFNDFAIDRAG
jgi:glycine/D-amino acid oxidase-like deaminating enzyme